MTQKTIFWLSIAFVILNVFDLITTWAALNIGLQEGNVLIKQLVENHFFVFSVIKLSAVGVIIYVYNKCFTEHIQMKIIALMCSNFVYFGIVLNNFYLVWRFS